MAELLKDRLNYDSIREFALTIQSAYSPFQVDEFLKSVMDETWGSLELKARGRKICLNLGEFLPADYCTAIGVIDEVVAKCDGFFCIIFPDFVEVYGQDEIHWDISMKALERYTQYSSSEWAVRLFIIKDEGRMMEQMRSWSKHENEHVRRLASEGCRPQLPWAQSLPSFKKDPTPILPILEQLKTDPSQYVRNSVANNINDISKTHPDLIMKLAKEWHGKNEATDWIIKHGLRTLLKKGNRDALAVFGFSDAASVEVSGFALETPAITLGEDLSFSFEITAKEATKVRLEYGIDYVKSNGKRSRKIFQISEVSLKENQRKPYTKKHSFADASTRKHYPGTHTVTLIVNGAERGVLDFTASCFHSSTSK